MFAFLNKSKFQNLNYKIYNKTLERSTAYRHCQPTNDLSFFPKIISPWRFGRLLINDWQINHYL